MALVGYARFFLTRSYGRPFIGVKILSAYFRTNVRGTLFTGPYRELWP